VTFVEHHRAHLTHAYITSPFHRCALLSLDGFGDFVSTAWGKGVAGKVTIGRRVFFPHSLGIFYTAITQFLGFDRYGEEYKVMALAPYGTPRYQHLLRELIVPTPRGFRLTPAYFEHTGRGVSMSFGEGVPSLGRVYRPRLTALLGPAKERDDPLTERHADLAASLQAVTETIVLSIARLVRDETREVCLAVAGGVALNSVANGVMRRSGLFRDIWIPSAPADDGTAIGAAAAVALKYGEGYPPHRENATPFLGPAYPAHHALRHRAGEEMRSIMERMVAALTRGEIVAWFRGRMEFGPRALGHRSIFADPRRADLRTVLNSRVKHREAFRPFAPIVLEEDAATYFELQGSSPNMMFVFPVRPPWRERLPAITHVDGSARVQTISPDLDPTLATLLTLWRERTGISVLLNTSFNENEPIVCTPKEAVACFQRTRMDVLVLEHALREKQALHSSCSCYTHGTPCG
jgi:carbamoyltransferase